MYSPSSHVSDFVLTERQRLKDDHLSMSLWLINLALASMSDYVPAVPGFEPASSRLVCYPLRHSGKIVLLIQWFTHDSIIFYIQEEM